jgi:hypothetical protein
MDPEFK